jgi:hypothetical protein
LTYQFEFGAAVTESPSIGTEILNRVSADGLTGRCPDCVRLVTASSAHCPSDSSVARAGSGARRRDGPGVAPAWARTADGPLTRLAQVLRETHGVVVRPDDWDIARLPDHLQ